MENDLSLQDAQMDDEAIRGMRDTLKGFGTMDAATDPFMEGACSLWGTRSSNIWTMVVRKRKTSILASTSPRHILLPARGTAVRTCRTRAAGRRGLLTDGEGDEKVGLKGFPVAEEPGRVKLVRSFPEIGVHVDGIQVRQDVRVFRDEVAGESRVPGKRRMRR